MWETPLTHATNMIYKYPHLNRFENWNFQDIKQYSGKLVLWGAGKIGSVAAHCLKKKGIEFLAYVDIAKDKQGKELCGHKIISPEEFFAEYSDCTVVISTIVHNVIVSNLLANGFSKEKILDCVSLFLEIDFEGYDFWANVDYQIRNVEQYLSAIWYQSLKTTSIDQLFVTVTTKCTMRCEHCSVFTPYLKNQKHSDFNIMMRSLHKVLDATGYVRVINLYGGEPFLYPQLAQTISSLKNETRFDRLSIITNGTILPNEEVINSIKNEPRMWFRISDYGEKSKKLAELLDLLNKNQIKYEVANYTYWDNLTKIGNTNETLNIIKQKFMSCTSCNVFFIREGHFNACVNLAPLTEIGAIPINETDFIDLCTDEPFETLKEKILKYMKRCLDGEFLSACKYCGGNHCVQYENKVPVAVQAKGILPLKNLLINEGK